LLDRCARHSQTSVLSRNSNPNIINVSAPSRGQAPMGPDIADNNVQWCQTIIKQATTSKTCVPQHLHWLRLAHLTLTRLTPLLHHGLFADDRGMAAVARGARIGVTVPRCENGGRACFAAPLTPSSPHPPHHPCRFSQEEPVIDGIVLLLGFLQRLGLGFGTRLFWDGVSHSPAGDRGRAVPHPRASRKVARSVCQARPDQRLEPQGT
jgi:hypothetical protein